MQITEAKLGNNLPIITHQLENNTADLHPKTEPRQKSVLKKKTLNFCDVTFSSATEYLALNNVLSHRMS